MRINQDNTVRKNDTSQMDVPVEEMDLDGLAKSIDELIPPRVEDIKDTTEDETMEDAKFNPLPLNAVVKPKSKFANIYEQNDQIFE